MRTKYFEIVKNIWFASEHDFSIIDD